MNYHKPVRIVGFGKYLPRQVLSCDIEKKYGLPGGWSIKYSGVSSRHHVTFESNGYMGARAIENALENTNVPLSDIDLIISAAATFDYPLPNRSSVIKSELHACNNVCIPAIDIDSSCLSFVSAFEYASRLLDGNQYKKIVIVSSEVSSLALDPENWETLTLFGDAAVAVILEYDETKDSCFIKGGHRTYSEGVYDTMVKGGGNKFFFKDHPYDSKLHSFSMNGKNLLRLARNKIPGFMDWFFSDLPVAITDIDAVIPHQASKFGIMMFKNLYEFKEGQVKENIATNGNCIAASIPMTLYDSIELGSIKRGDSCLLCGTSAGFSIGGVLIKY
ncbi:MAG: 3-oxoacyl-[acyl-carrier-protein] synthase III C-terminal domain-containing protein [Bacteroidota bacterium]